MSKQLTDQAYMLCERIRNACYQNIMDMPINEAKKLIRVQNKAFKRYVRRRNASEKFIEY